MSAQMITGPVENISSKQVNTKRGPAPVYALTVGQAGGVPVDVNVGFKNVYTVGQTVSLPVEVKYGGFQLVQGAPQPTPTGPVAKVTPVNSPPQTMVKPVVQFPTQKGTKDVSIIRQNSLTHATKTVDDAIDHGTLKAPATLDDYLDAVLKAAYLYQDYSTGWREERMAEASLEE